MKEITKRQKEVLNFISSFIKENGFPPTVREIGEFFSISLRAVQDHVAALQKKGFLSQSQKRARSISVLIEEKNDNTPCVTKVPVLGTIVSGKTVFCEENIDSYINLIDPIVKSGKSYFAIRARGTSMKDVGILEGDLAIIEKTDVAVDGQIVVALVDGAIMLKRFYKESDRIRLQSENPDFPAIYSSNAQVLGVLSSIVRSY